MGVTRHSWFFIWDLKSENYLSHSINLKIIKNNTCSDRHTIGMLNPNVVGPSRTSPECSKWDHCWCIAKYPRVPPKSRPQEILSWWCWIVWTFQLQYCPLVIRVRIWPSWRIKMNKILNHEWVMYIISRRIAQFNHIIWVFFLSIISIILVWLSCFLSTQIECLWAIS